MAPKKGGNTRGLGFLFPKVGTIIGGMSGLLQKLFPKRPVRVYGLVGRSGTGKSYRSQLIADRNHIPLVIDDGLLIRGDTVLAGRSAKQEASFVTAMRCAVFRNEERRAEVVEALRKEKFHKILILGTSEKMVGIIAARLGLPAPCRILKIEDFATKEEIETALRIRYTEGKHVIPVPAIEITRRFPQIVYDSVRVFLKRLPCRRGGKSYEKTLVKPGFSVPEAKALTRNTFLQMIGQCLYDYDSTIKIDALEVQFIDGRYKLQIGLRSPDRIPPRSIPDLKEYIIDSLEKYSSIRILDAEVTANQWSASNVQETLKRMNEQIEQVQGIDIKPEA